MVAPAIEVRGLHMAYGRHRVLDGVDLRVGRGEVVALLGPNGAGKTTMIEILEGFRRRVGGEVDVLGVDPETGDDAWRARLGVVFQSWRDHAKWRVRPLLEHMAALYAPYTSPERPRPADIDAILATVGLGDRREAKIRTLSGGQRRRLDVALALVGHPEVLFLDEPTAGFDPHAQRDFIDLVHRLSDLDDTTVLLTTHDLHEAEQVADRIVILADGRIIAEGSADELARQLDDRAEVRWRVNGAIHVHVTDDAAGFVEQLRVQHGTDVSDLEVRRPSLHDTYLALVERAERGSGDRPLRPAEEVAR